MMFGTSWFLFVLLYGAGGLGLPLGMPPAPEDPMMARIAPADVSVYVTWTGVAEIDPDADPTQKWMAQEEIQTAAEKFQNALVKQLINADASSLSDMQVNLIVEVGLSAFYHGGAVYCDRLDFRQPDPIINGAGLIALGENSKIHQTFEDLVALIESADEKTAPQISIIEENGLKKIVLRDDASEIQVEFAIWKKYFAFAAGETKIESLVKNSQTDPPAWLTAARQRLEIEKFSSMAYLSGSVAQAFDFAQLGLEDDIDFESIQSAAAVSGLDKKGALTRSFFDLKPDSDIKKLLPNQPLTDFQLARLPESALLRGQIAIPVDAVVDAIAKAGKKIGEDPIAEAEEEIQEILGVSLREELLNVFDGTAALSIDLPGDALFGADPELIAVFGIKDEMSFPATYETVIDTISKWDEVSDGLEVDEYRNFTTYEFAIPRRVFFGPKKLCWSHINDQLVFASNTDLIEAQIDRALGDDSFVTTAECQELIEYGRSKGYGNPTSVGAVDFVKVMKVTLSVLNMFGGGEQELMPGFTTEDIPDIEVLANGLRPSVSGLFVTSSGFEFFNRSSLPTSSPPVTFVAGGAVALLGRSQSSVAMKAEAAPNQDLQRIRQLGLAAHNFESVYLSLPATGTMDEDGNALLSWRVHLLPFLDQNDLYQQFHLDEPWDSDHNIKLLEKMPDVFGHPDLKNTDGKTTFLGCGGEEGIFGPLAEEADGEHGFGNIIDGLTNTVLIVQVQPSSAVPWTKPADLTTDGESAVKATEKLKDHVNVCMGDGSARQLDQEALDAEMWDQLLTINDGLFIEIDDLTIDGNR